MFQVKVLSNKEFARVANSDPRYVGVDDDNLGFADPVTGTAYVRFTAYPELNKYLMEHEFEHLLEEEGTDEDEFGIRHKKGKKFFKELFLPVITSAISGYTTGGPPGAAIGAGLGAFQGRQKYQERRAGTSQQNLEFPSQPQQSQSSSVFGAFNPSSTLGSIVQNIPGQTSRTEGQFSRGLLPGGGGLRGSSREPNVSYDPFQEYRYGSPFGRPYYF